MQGIRAHYPALDGTQVKEYIKDKLKHFLFKANNQVGKRTINTRLESRSLADVRFP